MKSYYVYVTVLPDKKFYIGCHCGNPNDNYYGSGRNITEWIKENGIFELRKVIKKIGSFDDCSKLERELIEKYIEHPDCLNKRIVGHTVDENSRKKISEALTGIPKSKEHKEKITGIGNGMYGKHHSEESKKEISEALTGIPKSKEHRQNISNALKESLAPEEVRKKISERFSGEGNGMYGKHLSEESKKKISEKISGENNGMYGRNHSLESNLKNSISNKNRPKFPCKYCGKLCHKGTLSRWHDENCKFKNKTL